MRKSLEPLADAMWAAYRDAFNALANHRVEERWQDIPKDHNNKPSRTAFRAMVEAAAAFYARKKAK